MAHALAITLRCGDGDAPTFRRVLSEITAPSRAEDGNLSFHTHQSVDDENVFFVYESYVDEAAYDAHLQTPGFERVQRELFPLLQERAVEVFETIEPS